MFYDIHDMRSDDDQIIYRVSVCGGRFGRKLLVESKWEFTVNHWAKSSALSVFMQVALLWLHSAGIINCSLFAKPF